MNKLYLLMVALFIAGSVEAQSCLPEGIAFTIQEQIDSFQINYPGCVAIEGDVLIRGENSITDLTGLNVLTSVGGNFAISFNYLLTSLEGLEGLNSIGGDLNIFHNTLLTSLAGLDSIDAGSIINIRIVGNDTLSTCAIQSICDYLASPNGSIEIHSNDIGCNSPNEVLDVCILDLNESAVSGQRSAVSIFPNPACGTIIISTPATPDKSTLLTIYNLKGRQLIKRQITEQRTVVDVSGLVSGIYFVKMASDNGVMVGKFLKQ